MHPPAKFGLTAIHPECRTDAQICILHAAANLVKIHSARRYNCGMQDIGWLRIYCGLVLAAKR
jgi:hypothetical protein